MKLFSRSETATTLVVPAPKEVPKLILPAFEIVDAITGEVLDTECETWDAAAKRADYLQKNRLRECHINAARNGAISARSTWTKEV